jgi:hypothetical protein
VPQVVPHTPSGEREANAEYATWLRRLANAEITHVMSFLPPSVELTWMRENPQAFSRVAGQGDRWGLFEVRSPARPK